MKNNKLTIFNYSFFTTIIAICIVLTIALRLNWLTLLSCISGIFYIVFLSDRSVLNFIVGFISSTTYIWVAYHAQLYGEVIFYLVIDLPMIFISFYMWKKNLDSTLRVSARRMTHKQVILLVLCAIIAVVTYSFFLKAIGGRNYVVDAISTIVSFIATILMAKRYREQWFMWVVVYLVSVIMWSTTFDLLMLIMSSCCLISCVIGYINWSKNSKAIR